MKRCRGKQPDPSAKRLRALGRVDADCEVGTLDQPPPLPDVDEDMPAEVGDQPQPLPVVEEDGSAQAGPTQGWSLLEPRIITALVSRVVRDTDDKDLDTLTIQPLLQAVVSRSDGRLTMEACLASKDDFIAAAMETIPKELSKRLLQAVGKKSVDQKKGTKSVSETQEPEPKQIDSQIKQKSYLITWSGLRADSSPDRQAVLEAVLSAFTSAGYGATAIVTHAAVFQEKHVEPGKIHYHIATSLSECVRWLAWKKELAKKDMICHFSQMSVADHSQHRRMQYPLMLRYLFLPTSAKPLHMLDRMPVLWTHKGKHPPLMDAINGQITATGLEEAMEEAFLQKKARQKNGPGRFGDLELWPIVTKLKIEEDDPLLVSKLLQYGRNSGNVRLLNYLFRHSAQSIQDKVAMSWALERCDEVIAESTTSTWKKLTAVLQGPCVCDRQWAPGAREIIANNGFSEADLCQDFKRAIMGGLQKKQDVICFAGSGNEGKSYLLKPLSLIYKHVTRWHRSTW